MIKYTYEFLETTIIGNNCFTKKMYPCVNSMDPDISCCICYYQIDSGLKCTGCGSVVCDECCTEYFKVSQEQRIVPKCTSPTCNSLIFYSDVPKRLEKSFSECMKAYLLTNPDEKVQMKMSKEAMVQKVRKEKLEFAVENFPEAVLFMANICMSKKLKTLTKKQKQKIENIITETAKRSCFNQLCHGKLSSDMICCLCETSFCPRCESKKESPDHECKKEDLESLEEIRNSKKCPECQTPIFKHVGCEMMTCTVCKTNFHYGSGEKTEHGNNHNKNLNLKNHTYLHVTYESELTNLGENLYTDIMHFENSVHIKKDSSSLANALVMLYNSPNDFKLLKVAMKCFEQTRKDQVHNKMYASAVLEIEKLILSKKLTSEHIATIRSRFQ